MFFQNVDAIIGPDDAIVYPEGLTKELDYELELGIVIGKSGKFFGPDEAEDYIAGYLVFNDITARDIQRREMQSGVFSFSKAHRHVLPDRPVDRHQGRDPRPAEHCAMELRVNGDVRQQGNTAQMVHLASRTWSRYHSAQGYSAGDIITTGTISGVAAVQPNPFDFYLQPGDQIEAEIEGVGVLRNHVVPWSAAHDTAPYTTDLYSSDGRLPMRFGTVDGRARRWSRTAGRSTSPTPRAARCPRTRSRCSSAGTSCVAWAPSADWSAAYDGRRRRASARRCRRRARSSRSR